MSDFNEEVEKHQVNWRRNPKNKISTQTPGVQRGVARDWILPVGKE